MDYATLSNEEGYTVFEFENYRIGINTSRTNICITLLFPLML